MAAGTSLIQALAAACLIGLLATQLPMQNSEAAVIQDNNGDVAGELDVICTLSGSDCAPNGDVLIRYSASADRDLEIRDDQNCPDCLNGPSIFRSPSGDIYQCTGIVYPRVIPNGEIFEISGVDDCGLTLPVDPGHWEYLSDVLGFSEPVIAFFDISFFVVPESPIGIAVLLGSSLAALSGFILLKRKQSNRKSRSLTDLGI